MIASDVLVVGLGPAGASAAAAAAERGLKVVAIDRKKTAGMPVQCAEFIPMPLARYARGDGVRAQSVSGMRTVLPSGVRAQAPFSGLMIDRAAFDRTLVEAAARAGAALRFECQIVGLDADGATATLRVHDGKTLRVSYRALIAADGPLSAVARLLRLPRLETVDTRQYSVPLSAPQHETDIWLSRRYPGGYAWLFPKGERANLGVGLDRRCGVDMKAALDALHAQLAREGRVGDAILSRTGGPIPVGGLRGRLVEGNVVFAGDAAGLAHPISGAGIAAAVASGERAGEAVHGLIAQGSAAALAEYEQDIRDQYAESLERALERRRELRRVGNTACAEEDAVQRRGWIAFPEYFGREHKQMTLSQAAVTTTLPSTQTVHFYRPNHHVRTPDMRSPDFVQMSTAAAITLGLTPGRMHRTACTHCLNLLVTYPEGCRANCAYCGLARHREEARDYADRNFIRVDWPTARYDDVIARVKAGADRGQFHRMCISMITHPRSNDDTFVLLDRWVREVPRVPVSILSNPTTLEKRDLERMRDMGAGIFTVALDAVTPAIFERTRGKGVDSPHRFEHYWRAIEWAAEVFGPERFGAHLICGMGETEREILKVAQTIRDLGGHNHMFAFFPERGSLMEDWPAVGRGQWRRVQLARYIIDYAGGHVGRMDFDEHGRVTDFGMSRAALERLISSGKPFRTSGCPGEQDDVSACNRPYGDSSPTDILSFPFALERRDVQKVRRQLNDEDVKAGL